MTQQSCNNTAHIFSTDQRRRYGTGASSRFTNDTALAMTGHKIKWNVESNSFSIEKDLVICPIVAGQERQKNKIIMPWKRFTLNVFNNFSNNLIIIILRVAFPTCVVFVLCFIM